MRTTLADSSARNLLQGYRTGEFSPREVIDAVLARIDARESVVNALWAHNRDEVIAQADASTQRWLKKESIGNLNT